MGFLTPVCPLWGSFWHPEVPLACAAARDLVFCWRAMSFGHRSLPCQGQPPSQLLVATLRKHAQSSGEQRGETGTEDFLLGRGGRPANISFCILPAKSVACPSSSGGLWLRACASCSKKLGAEPLLPWGARGRDLEPPGDVTETHPCFPWAAGRAGWPWLCFSAPLRVPGCRACACSAGLSRAGSRRAGRPPLLPPPGISRSVTSE